MRAGDNLQSIAGQLWGDSSQWYKLAEANGLSANAALNDGMVLRVPSGVINNSHNANTFAPYNPNAAIGDTKRRRVRRL